MSARQSLISGPIGGRIGARVNTESAASTRTTTTTSKCAPRIQTLGPLGDAQPFWCNRGDIHTADAVLRQSKRRSDYAREREKERERERGKERGRQIERKKERKRRVTSDHRDTLHVSQSRRRQTDRERISGVHGRAAANVDNDDDDDEDESTEIDK